MLKLTKKQQKAIASVQVGWNIKSTFGLNEVIRLHNNKGWMVERECLNKLSLHELIQALFGEVEVIEEFTVDDLSKINRIKILSEYDFMYNQNLDCVVVIWKTTNDIKANIYTSEYALQSLNDKTWEVIQ